MSCLEIKKKENCSTGKPESSPRPATIATVEFLLACSPATLSFVNILCLVDGAPTPRMPRRHGCMANRSRRYRCTVHSTALPSWEWSRTRSHNKTPRLPHRPIRNQTSTKSSLRKRTICKSSIEIDTIDASEKHRSVSFLAFFFPSFLATF